MPATPPGISMEEAEQLRTTIADLQEELAETTARLAAKENSEKKLSKKLNTDASKSITLYGGTAQSGHPGVTGMFFCCVTCALRHCALSDDPISCYC